MENKGMKITTAAALGAFAVTMGSIAYMVYKEGEKNTPLNKNLPAEKFNQAAKFEPIQDKIREDLLKVFVVPGECPEKVLPPQITCNSEPAPKNITDCTACPDKTQDIR